MAGSPEVGEVALASGPTSRGGEVGEASPGPWASSERGSWGCPGSSGVEEAGVSAVAETVASAPTSRVGEVGEASPGVRAGAAGG